MPRSRGVVAAVSLALLSALNCSAPAPRTESGVADWPPTPYLVVLGTVQDAGSPQAACAKTCCADLWLDPDPMRQVSCLGLVDPARGATYLFDATPDLPRQLYTLGQHVGDPHGLPAGIFLTHAHTGHYTGLIHLGREAIGADGVPVYAMPRLDSFLRADGPWSQLVALGNVQLRPLREGVTVALAGDTVDTAAGKALNVTPLRVPHRDEYSETVGYRIAGPQRTALFIPDIDKWRRWDRDLAAELADADYALVDGTFFCGNELPGRDMSAIPHPSVEETMALLASLPASERAKVRFIHLNHTNPLLDPASAESARVRSAGFAVARYGDVLPL